MIKPGILFAKVRNGFCGACDSEAGGAWCVVGPNWSPYRRVPGETVTEVRHSAQNVGDPLRISELEVLLGALEQIQNGNPKHPGPWTWPA